MSWQVFSRRCAVLCFGLALLGCGSQVEDRSDVMASYNVGIEAFAKDQHEEANKAFTAAIDRGGLAVDQFVDAHVRRAVSRAKLGNAAGAHADLDVVEQGAPNLDVVYAARAFVLQSEGKSSEAAAMMSKARARNPDVKAFGG